MQRPGERIRRRTTKALTMQTDIQTTRAPADSLHSVVGASGQCVSCGAPAVLKNYHGEYCRDCMQLHILEKMFVNLTAMQKPK